MKKRNFLCLLLIALCIATWMGYRTLDRLWTDQTAPEIQVQDTELMLSVQDSREKLLQGISAFDDRDGDVTDSLIVESIRLADASTGKISVTLAAFDHSGNVAKTLREAVYTDYHSTRILLNKAMVYTQNTDYDPMEAIVALDDLDGDITYRVRAMSMGESAVNTLGVHPVQFRVTNSMSDTTVLELPVEVIEPNLYNAQLELTDYLVYLEKGEQFDEKAYLNVFRYGSTSVSLQDGLPGSYSLKTYGTVNTGVPGVYALSYLLTYDTGSQSADYAAYSKIIVVVEG